MRRRSALAESLGAAGPLLARDWRLAAECATVDPELFFPPVGAMAQSRAARRVCARCPVTGECLDFAFREDIRSGIYGGLTADERDSLRRAANRRARLGVAA